MNVKFNHINNTVTQATQKDDIFWILVRTIHGINNKCNQNSEKHKTVAKTVALQMYTVPLYTAQ